MWRAVIIYCDTQRYPSLYRFKIDKESRSLSTQFLYSYRLNAQTGSSLAIRIAPWRTRRCGDWNRPTVPYSPGFPMPGSTDQRHPDGKR